MIRNWEDWVLTQSFWLYLHCYLRTCSKSNYQPTCINICRSVPWLVLGHLISNSPKETQAVCCTASTVLWWCQAENISWEPSSEQTRFFTEGSWHSWSYWWMGLLGSRNGGCMQQQVWWLGWNFFSESSFILPESLLFLSLLSKVMLLLFLCIKQDLREEEEEICGRTCNASPPSPKSELTKFLPSSVF